MAATTARTGPLAAFIRFVIFGGGVTLLAGGVLMLIGDRVPFALANAAVTVVSTVLATELHGRFTFGRGGAGWSDHLASGLTVLMSYLFTTAAVFAFDGLHPGGGALLRQGVYLGASGAAGVARFLLLRYVVFTPARPTTPAVPRVRLPRPAVGRLSGRAAGLVRPAAGRLPRPVAGRLPRPVAGRLARPVAGRLARPAAAQAVPVS